MEDNKCADYLAKLASERWEDLQLFESPPNEALEFFKADKERIFVPLEYSMQFNF
ncbi:hypothetical protein J1N35_040387, partial [Gossypium stocksii]